MASVDVRRPSRTDLVHWAWWLIPSSRCGSSLPCPKWRRCWWVAEATIFHHFSYRFSLMFPILEVHFSSDFGGGSSDHLGCEAPKFHRWDDVPRFLPELLRSSCQPRWSCWSYVHCLQGHFTHPSHMILLTAPTYSIIKYPYDISINITNIILWIQYFPDELIIFLQGGAPVR